MAGSEENNSGVIGPENAQGGFRGRNAKLASGVAMGQPSRRALSNINRNIMGVAPHYPCAVNKRTVSERQEADKKSLIELHRPITRKFAAQLASKQNPKAIKDCSIIDVEDYNAASDFSVPMFVQHTEAMLEEIDQIEEVEMEDVNDDLLIIDIDSPDKNNPLAVVEYVDELYVFYKDTEISSSASPDYMMKQFDINERMRGILIDWLIEVHYKFELMDETLFLTVNIIDRFLAVHPVVRKKLQLVGVTAMLLACKYEEVSVPVVDDLILISDKAYSRKEVLDMEKLMVNTLQYNVLVTTPYVFMRRFLKAAQADKKLELLSFFLIELSLVEYEMLKFPPSMLAAAAVFTANCTLAGSKQWSRTNEFYTNYTEEQLLECSRLMVTFHKTAGTGKLTGVNRKYSTSKFGYTARTQPASFLVNA